MRWIVGAHTHGCWLGTYESEKQRAFVKEITEGMTVYDVGANVGFYSLLAARCVGDSGRVYAFEPLPANVAYLRRHVQMNQLHQVDVHPVAVSDARGPVRFAPGDNRAVGQITLGGALEVQSVTLDDFVFNEGNRPPQVIKIDVEGAEELVLEGARRILRECQPVLFLATHGTAVHRQCCERLTNFGYTCEGILGEPADTTDELLCRPAIGHA